MITQQRLRDLFHYDPETGFLTNRVNRGRRAKIGMVCGTGPCPKGYLTVVISKKSYRLHRIIWAYVHGEWPEVLDHKDCNGCNNRLKNLRIATKSQNMMNSRKRGDNTSGVKGICWNREKSKWTASLWKNGKQKFLGYFENKNEAIDLLQKTRLQLHGDFSKNE